MDLVDRLIEERASIVKEMNLQVGRSSGPELQRLINVYEPRIETITEAINVINDYRYLSGLATEYNNTPETEGFEEPHPIFMMAQEIDDLGRQVNLLSERLESMYE